MHLRTIADLDDAVRAWIPRLPGDIDVVVGVPRSGLLAATMLALHLNRPVATVDGLLAGRVEGHGSTRSLGLDVEDGTPVLERPRRVLVVDDSIDTGASLRRVRDRITAADLPHEVVYGVVYGRPGADHPEADLVAERVPIPRVMSWNLLHHPVLLQHMAVALEGVLVTPPPAGTPLADHLEAAEPIVVPTGEVGVVVTALSGATHDLVTTWLDRHGVQHRSVQVTGPTTGGPPLADAYRASDTALLLVADDVDASAVSAAVHRPVLATASMRLHDGGARAALSSKGSALLRRLRPLLGEALVRRLRQVRAGWRRTRARWHRARGRA